MTSMPWWSCAAATTSAASCHHGIATSNGASAPWTVPSLLHSTRVTVRGTPVTVRERVRHVVCDMTAA